jgi:hypothetical protein
MLGVGRRANDPTPGKCTLTKLYRRPRFAHGCSASKEDLFKMIYRRSNFVPPHLEMTKYNTNEVGENYTIIHIILPGRRWDTDSFGS